MTDAEYMSHNENHPSPNPVAGRVFRALCESVPAGLPAFQPQHDSPHGRPIRSHAVSASMWVSTSS